MYRRWMISVKSNWIWHCYHVKDKWLLLKHPLKNVWKYMYVYISGEKEKIDPFPLHLHVFCLLKSREFTKAHNQHTSVFCFVFLPKSVLKSITKRLLLSFLKAWFFLLLPLSLEWHFFFQFYQRENSLTDGILNSIFCGRLTVTQRGSEWSATLIIDWTRCGGMLVADSGT